MNRYRRRSGRIQHRNDILIAATCRQVDATLLTANIVDYELLHRVMGVRYLAHFPSR